MIEIDLNLGKTLEQNASDYFEKSKKLKKKISGAKTSLEKTKLQLSSIKQDMPSIIKRSVRKKAWYEKFRWFISSEGFLVVGGRDAATNEIVIKKHAEPNDLVFHTDMAGSPFFVIKSENKKIGEITIREAADATCVFSRAWQKGMQSTDVFYIKPEQATKHAKPGEFVPKGAFIIEGKVNYSQNKANIAIGIYEEKVMAGPIDAIKKHCKEYVEIIQGDKKISDAAKIIQKKIGGELDEIVRALPTGGCNIKTR